MFFSPKLHIFLDILPENAKIIQDKVLLEYTVIIHRAEEGGYWVEVPALPGCYSQGETMEEALVNAKEAVELHLEDLKEETEIPRDTGFVFGRVEVPSA